MKSDLNKNIISINSNHLPFFQTDKVVQRLSDQTFSSGENNSQPFFAKAIMPLQRKCAECEQEEKLQRKSDESSPQTALFAFVGVCEADREFTFVDNYKAVNSE